MRSFITKRSLVLIAAIVIGAPLYSWFQYTNLSWGTSLFGTLFPAFGLLAFTIMYLHIIGRPFASHLEDILPWASLERGSSYIVLILIILHPVFRLIYYIGEKIPILPTGALALPIYLGFLGFAMLITYDIGRAFIRSAFVTRHWNAIDIISTLGFFVIFFHSLALGSTLQTQPLRSIWIFYGLTGMVAFFYSFVIQPTRAKNKSF